MPDTRMSLLSRIKDPADEASWAEFDQLYRPLLLQYALLRGVDRDEAEEIAQQCMVAILSGIRGFRRRVSFRGWLRGMIENKVSDRLRVRRREATARSADFERPQECEETPLALWERQWNRTHLLYSLNQLRGEIAPVTYRAFELYVLEEKPVKEICDVLDMTANQVYVAKSRVLARLRKRWAELGDGLIGD